MFEKEAEEYVPNIKWHDFSSKDIREEMMLCYRKGAEFGYNKALEEATHNYNAIIADYDKRIAELKSIAQFQTTSNMDRSFQLKRSKEQLTKAKEILKKVLDLKKVVTKAEEYLLLEEAEQFLSDVEK